MATENRDRKYGRNNISMDMDGTDIVIRIDGRVLALNNDGTSKAAGTPNPTKDNPNKVRGVDLVATSGGFKGIDSFQVSLNVTS